MSKIVKVTSDHKTGRTKEGFDTSFFKKAKSGLTEIRPIINKDTGKQLSDTEYLMLAYQESQRDPSVKSLVGETYLEVGKVCYEHIQNGGNMREAQEWVSKCLGE